MQTRSGRRSATQATARSVAARPRDGMPRWKSERCAMRRPSSALGEARDPDLEHAHAEPAGLEQAVREQREREERESREARS